jgi:hypothetical protein
MSVGATLACQQRIDAVQIDQTLEIMRDMMKMERSAFCGDYGGYDENGAQRLLPARHAAMPAELKLRLNRLPQVERGRFPSDRMRLPATLPPGLLLRWQSSMSRLVQTS